MYFRALSSLFIICFFVAHGSSTVYGQDSKENIDNAETYLDHRLSALEKYNKRASAIQQKLLKKLQRKENKLLKQLAAKDSSLYNEYLQQGKSYDTIALLSVDTAYQNKAALQNNTAIDSLKGVQRFIEKQQQNLGSINSITNKTGIALPKEFSDLQGQINAQKNIDNLIQQKANALKGFASQHANIKGLEGIQKDVFYAKEKIKAYKEMADDPDKAEADAFEFLQGTEGFDKFLQPKNNAYGGLGNNATAADLQRMGYQTKSTVNTMLQQKLGNSLGAVQQQMSSEVQDYMDKLTGIAPVDDIKKGVRQSKDAVATAKDAAATAKETKSTIQNTAKPGFKPNAEKGKPFWQRFEMQYNFQTSKASTDGLKPAMMDIGGAAGYKQNERLSFGIGLGLTTGLGQNWQHIKLSYEGISARAYADWKWIYGFSFQAGYEHLFRPTNSAYLSDSENPQNNNNPDTQTDNNALKNAFGGQQQVAYVGIMKRYKLNSKYNGTFLAGYNLLWQQEGMRSPWLLRFGWAGK